MDISELQWHVKQEKQELIKAEEKLDYASTINKGGFQSYTLHTLESRELVQVVPYNWPKYWLNLLSLILYKLYSYCKINQETNISV